MPRMFMWRAANPAGEELLERHVRPLAARMGAQLEVPGPDDDRRRLIRAVRECDVVICDGSVEPGHLYHKYVELPKTNNHVALCSRTPLPRNVYAFHQFAPPHGGALTNAEIAAWLDAAVPAIAAGNAAGLGYWEKMRTSLDAQAAAVSARVGLFVSYRGRLYPQVRTKAAEMSARLGMPLRVVPKGEFAYESECMTRQMTWATVAALEKEIRRARGVMIVASADYLDSFWTASELLITLLFRRDPDGTIRGGILLDEKGLEPGPAAAPRWFSIDDPTPAERREYNRLLRQSDAGTVAPERRRNNPGLIGAFFGLIAAATGHSRTPEGEWWWSDLMVPCPGCRPSGRAASQLRWSAHLAMEGYGYFPVSLSELAGRTEASARCPACDQAVRLVSRRPPRTFWVPGPLGRPWPADLEVIEREPLWETTD